LGRNRLQTVIGFASQMFLTGLVIALPVTLILLMVQVATGIVSRSAPSLNLFSLGLPAGVLAGIAALIASAPLMTDRMTDLTTAAVEQAGAVVAR